jgi:hypothetical protein
MTIFNIIFKFLFIGSLIYEIYFLFLYGIKVYTRIQMNEEERKERGLLHIPDIQLILFWISLTLILTYIF